jgi:hypothetical protein
MIDIENLGFFSPETANKTLGVPTWKQWKTARCVRIDSHLIGAWLFILPIGIIYITIEQDERKQPNESVSEPYIAQIHCTNRREIEYSHVCNQVIKRRHPFVVNFAVLKPNYAAPTMGEIFAPDEQKFGGILKTCYLQAIDYLAKQ